jgi:hypothetical protein
VQTAKDFIIDFVRQFVVILYTSLITVTEVISVASNSLQKFVYNVVRPALVEGLADLGIILTVLWLGLLALTSDCCLCVAKVLVNIAQSLHDRAESIMRHSW